MSLKASIANVIRAVESRDLAEEERQAKSDSVDKLLNERGGVENETAWALLGAAEWAARNREKASTAALQALLTTLTTADETKSTRIPFMGSEDFSRCNKIVVSFPGAYGVAWVFLTRSDTSGLATSCVFLPDENADGYGAHVYIPTACVLPGDKGNGSRKNVYIPIPILDSAADGDGISHCASLKPRKDIAKCFCFHLYGQQMEFGCKWYQAWMENTVRAKRSGKDLIVVTKADGTLGNSQKGEVRFLEKQGFKFTFMNISDFAQACCRYRVTQRDLSLLCDIVGH